MPKLTDTYSDPRCATCKPDVHAMSIETMRANRGVTEPHEWAAPSWSEPLDMNTPKLGDPHIGIAALAAAMCSLARASGTPRSEIDKLITIIFEDMVETI